MNKELKKFLNAKVDFYNQPSFIKDDPICIPHLVTKQQDIEIAGFFAAGAEAKRPKKTEEKSQVVEGRFDHAKHAAKLKEKSASREMREAVRKWR